VPERRSVRSFAHTTHTTVCVGEGNCFKSDMTSLDYTELFVKGGGGELTVDDIYRDDGEENEGCLITTGTNQVVDSLAEIGDGSTWILNKIEALGFSYPNSELSPELIQIFTSLFREVTTGSIIDFNSDLFLCR
jgi:hypothetical protein